MSELFPDKYSPKIFDEFIGNVEIVDNAIKWAKDWQNGVSQKPLLFFGSPGVGKTALAYLIAKEMNWQLFEMNSSDLRNKDAIEKIVGAATGNASLFGTKRLILIDEVDSLHSVDRGGAAAISQVIKSANNPIILTANNIYSDKKLVMLRTITTLMEFKKINYLSIAKRLREICEIENINFDPEAIKLLAKNSGGDFRGALLDLETISPNIQINEVEKLFSRMKKEKVFLVMTKIFKGHNMQEISQMVDNSEISADLLMKWVEENIPRQYDGIDSAKAFSILSRSDIFRGRIMRRQHYGFLKYVYFLSTVGIGISRSKDYTGWVPFQFPGLLSSLSASTSKRALRKQVAKKIGKKTHSSINDSIQDIPFFQMLFASKELAPNLTYYFEFDDKELAFILNTKADTKKIKTLIEQAQLIKKEKIISNNNPLQSKLFS